MFQSRPSAFDVALNLSTHARRTVEELWESLPVSRQTAEFLSLGCLLPGEVRLTPGRVDTYHLPAVNLRKRENGEDVTVDFEEDEARGEDENKDSASAAAEVFLASPPPQKSPEAPIWTAWHDSAFRGMSKKELEPQLNLRLRELSVDRDRVKSREFKNFQFEFELKGRYG